MSGNPSTDSGAYRAVADESLLALCRAIGSNLALEEVLDAILDAALRDMRAQEASILLAEDGDALRMIASRGLPPEVVARGYLPRKGSIAEWVLERDEPLILTGEVRTAQFHSAGGRRSIASSLCVPLRARGAPFGVLNVNRTHFSEGPFVERDRDRLLILAAQAASSIDNARLHRAALRAERLAAIGQTVSGVAHCMKNVLTSLKGGVSLCELGLSKGDDRARDEGLAMLRRGVDRVSTLAHDMLDYSKERSPETREIDLDAMGRELADAARAEAERGRARFEYSLAPDARTVKADPNHLFRCLLNLVHNAIHAAGENGVARLATERCGRPESLAKLRRGAEAAHILRVSDTGPGVPPDVAPRLFEPFFSTKGSKGTGLGLSVSRKLMEDNGGTLELESPPGRPAVFAVYLPA